MKTLELNQMETFIGGECTDGDLMESMLLGAAWGIWGGAAGVFMGMMGGIVSCFVLN